MRKLFITLIILSTSSTLLSQEKEKEKNIGTEVVNVVKPYSPTLSDAFKIKETPRLDDSVTASKKKISYNIFSVPVASTFVPAKGKATGLKRAPRESVYNSYASLAVGNYNNATADFYTSRALNRDETLDFSLNHHSSQGGIDGVELDDKFFKTKLAAAYNRDDRYMDWGVEGGFSHQLYNWYGVPLGFYDESTLNSIDEKQSYYTANLGADLVIEDSFFTGGDVSLRYFFDAFSSGESNIVLNPKFELPVGEEWINLNLSLDYLNGKFDRNYYTTEQLKYSNLITKASPNLVILKDDLTVNLGATVAYKFDIENSDSDIYFYPNITASYRLVQEYVTVYGGLEGDLKQNSYHGFQEENPYISPTLNILPTDKTYDGYVGVKGKFLPNLSYNLRGSYINESNKPLFAMNPETGTINYNTEGYAYANSFGLIYDDITTISVFGEISVDVNRDFQLGINAEILDYNTDDEEEAWNLPSIKGSLFMDYQINNKWFLGANIFYTGERSGLFRQDTGTNPGETFNMQVVDLDSFFDINAKAGYRINDQFSVYLKANNIANNEYTRWSNYMVQGFQVLAGVSYKFDM
ncbi:TonB-dependent receptor [Zhouia amylolytica]|uniref:Outer membrane receptor protein n=1 Tax=Zhouia amylolytica AD3 TaxID=1286632 RepID=W2US18_9FLAO|nr:TonB-dependent receptor [Zhouia amylolytica]ETN96783.1 outer membrane receptor protein [Zhouia amylolytica AD3]